LAFRNADEMFLSGTTGVIYIAPDPLVTLAENTVAAPGSIVTVPVSIDNARYLETAELEIHYDTGLLDVSAVRLGSLTGDGELSVVVDDAAGILFVSINLPSVLTGGAGSLAEIDFAVSEEARRSRTLLDLQRVSLNDGALLLTEVPQVGEDSTDGTITVRKARRPDRPVALFDLPGQRLNGGMLSEFRKGKIRWD
jgi:hypothetical protein